MSVLVTFVYSHCFSTLNGCTGVGASATTGLVGLTGLRAAVSAADLVGLRPVTETVLATALGLQAGEESSASTKEGTRARPNEEDTDGEGGGGGCGSTVCMLSGALSAFPLLVGLVHGWLRALGAWWSGVRSRGLRRGERACCALYCGRLELVGERFSEMQWTDREVHGSMVGAGNDTGWFGAATYGRKVSVEDRWRGVELGWQYHG